jgi:hypothetical protein
MKKSPSLLIRILKVICILGEFIACFTLLAALILIPISKSLVSRHRANVGVFVMNGSPEWTFYGSTGRSGSFSYHSLEGVVVSDRLPAAPVELPASTALGSLSIGPFRMTAAGDSSLSPQAVVGAAGVVHQPFSEVLTFTDDQEVTGLWNLIKWPFGIAVLCMGCAGLVILELIRRMLKRVGSGEAFSGRNIQDMRRIAFTLIGSAILKAAALAWLIGSMGNYAAQHTADKFTFAVTSGRGLPSLVVGLIILVLAEIFRQGLRLEEDAQLTV